jgi:hypothetical protein
METITTATPTVGAQAGANARAPHGLGVDGRKLWAWAVARYEIAGCEPLLHQLCNLSDRLAAVREELKKGAVDCRLINAETKLVAQFQGCWRLAGFADDAAGKRPVGRPQGQPLRRA